MIPEIDPSLDIIIISLSRHDNPYSSTSLGLGRELSKRNRVFYIDNPFTLREVFLTQPEEAEQVKKRRGALFFRKNIFRHIEQNKNLVVVTPPIALSINFLPKGWLYNFLSGINDRIL